MGTQAKKRLSKTWRYIIAILALIFFLFPIIWIFLTAFKTGDEFYHSPPIWIPHTPTLRSFIHVIETGGVRSLVNTMVIAISTTALSLLIGSMAGYGLARYKVGGNNLPFFILSQRFMPAVAVIFPFLLLFKMLKWIDTYQALIVIYLTFNLPYAVWMMRGFFQEIPAVIGNRRWWTVVLLSGRSGASPFPWSNRVWLPRAYSASYSAGANSSLPSV